MDIKYTDIKKANEGLKTTPIKGKTYVEVNQRVKAFRMVYPMGFIRTDIEDMENEAVIMKATVGYHTEDGVEVILGTGMAWEKMKSSFINQTSYIENCETSAVGRALGMAGFGIDASMASYEEVANAQLQQKAVEPPSYKTAPAPAPEGFTCCLCSKVFTDKRTATATMKKFGKYVCPDCVKAKTEEAKKKEQAKKIQEAADRAGLPFEII